MNEAPRHADAEPKLVVRDRRRIDPESGQVRTPEAEQEPAAETAGPVPADGDVEVDAVLVEPKNEEVEQLRAQLEERTADLQRLSAEFANYRKRIERDRELVVTAAKANVATELLAVLDDLERAEAHGDLTGAFKAVADKLIGALTKVGLEPFGHAEEPFDPSVHEAVQHATSPDVSGPTVTAVLRRGYRFGERVLRPALVAVTDHEPGAAPTAAEAEPVATDSLGRHAAAEPPHGESTAG